ncbi:hypothetical protein Lal_00001694 [Lupinus albus]|uniref:Uncharacterized protein n=1 Tax=Lupinus albus TaxID=3870 RepID=A0A6A5P7D2_LUPAL|nr:putative protein LIN52 [Lupinus albus]KAF1893246.1 hypothetical protein Lal_00001694 [Lupinus albus]
MIQQGLDYKVLPEGNSNQHTVAVNNKMKKNMTTSSILKYPPATDSNIVSGTKRPPSQCLQHSPLTTNINGHHHLVYVRRKSESELAKITPSANPIIIINNNSYSPHSTQQLESDHVTPSSTPTTMRLPPLQSNHVSTPTTGLQTLHWEDRYQQLHMFLRNLDISHQQQYIQMLQSLSSFELSRHAVELEKRSIQLSLEEARELQRVRVLNVLEKPVKNFKAPADHEECSDKLKTPS